MKQLATWTHWDQPSHAMQSEPVIIMEFLMAPGYALTGDYGAVYYNTPEATAVVRRSTGNLLDVPVRELMVSFDD